MTNPRDGDDTEAFPRPPLDSAPAYEKLELIVSVGSEFQTHRLPVCGNVTIGRRPPSAHSNHVCVRHPSISREHAVISVGTRLEVTDLGSRNGVCVVGHAIEPFRAVPFQPGDVIELGAIVMVVQRIHATRRSRRVWSHDYFEARIEEQCARAQRTGALFALFRLRAPNASSETVLESALASGLRSHDVIASYASGDYEVLVDASAETVEQIVTRVVSELTTRGIAATAGVAVFRRDGTTPEELISAASASLRSDSAPRDQAEPRVDGAMSKLAALVDRVAQSTISVLILGETGAGKEVLAEKIHALSNRADGTFLRLNCAALSESLMESELFGYERGAFTGAVCAKRGLLESAEGGTVLLDEVAELSLSTQVKLLRVLEERKVTRVGGLVPRPIDVRFLAATNRDLEDECERGRFRSDLFYRLNGVTLVVPPLRERRDEILALAAEFIRRFAPPDRKAASLSPEAVDTMLKYSWPGNIRELRNVIERAVLLCPGAEIRNDHLPVEKMNSPRIPASEVPSSCGLRTIPAPPVSSRDKWPELEPPSHRPPPETLQGSEAERDERQRIIEALETCAGNQSKAARLLGVSRGTLVDRLVRYRIPRPRKPLM